MTERTYPGLQRVVEIRSEVLNIEMTVPEFDSYLLTRRIPGGGGFTCEFCSGQYFKLRGLRRHLVSCPYVSAPIRKMAVSDLQAKKARRTKKAKQKAFGAWDANRPYRSSALNAPSFYPDDN